MYGKDTKILRHIIIDMTLVEKWFQEVWAEGQTQAIHDTFVPDGKAHGLGLPPPLGPNDFETFHSRLLQLVGNVKVTVELYSEYKDWLAIMAIFSAQDVKSGNSVSMTSGGFVRVKKDKILEAYNTWDFMGLFEQLELLPSGSFLTCLDGKNPCSTSP